MSQHPYICLSTTDDLQDNAVMAWFGSVKESGPSGCVSSVELRADRTPVRFYKRNIGDRNCYMVVLSRDLSMDEANAIASAYDQRNPDGDFEISWSQPPTVGKKIAAISEDLMKAIALEAAKRNHGRWVSQLTEEGWRYGQRHDARRRTTPALMDWENLSEKYRKIEYRRMLSLMETLDGMNLRIAGK